MGVHGLMLPIIIKGSVRLIGGVKAVLVGFAKKSPRLRNK